MAKRIGSIGLWAGLLALFFVCACFPAIADSERGIAVPFAFIHHEVVAQARINGQGPFAVLLDTGTNPSVIDLKIARRMGLNLDATGLSGDGGGTHANLAYATSLPAVDIGRFSAANVTALAMDLSGLSRKFGQPIQGVLGQSLFAGRVVQFDYPHRIARFFERSLIDPQIRRDPMHLVSFPCRDTDCIQFSGVLIDDKPVRANLDTGSSGAFSLTPPAIRRLGLERDVARAKIKRAAGFNGAYGSRIGTVRSIQVGAITRFAPSVTFWLPGTGHDALPYDVNIGNAFLQDFVVTIDYRANTVTLERP